MPGIRPIRVAFAMRVDAIAKPGGDLLQVQQYLAGGEGNGRPCEACYEGRIVTDCSPCLDDCDVVHLTNIDRPFETYSAYLAAKAARKPIVISTIHHSYQDIRHYERLGRSGALGSISRHFSYGALEYARTIFRARRYPALVGAVRKIPLGRVTSAQRAILEGADVVLVLSDKEAADLAADFAVTISKKYVLLRNGIECSPSLAKNSSSAPARDIDVCIVGRIEARKNQIAILQALDNLGVAGVFVGAENIYHKAYCDRFRRLIAKSQSTYIGPLSRSETDAIMRRSKVHVSASWFEVLPLVDLEAYIAGCRVVASVRGATNELLGDNAFYVRPDSPADIQVAIEKQLAGTSEQTSGSAPLHLATWAEVTSRLADVYRSLAVGQ